MDQFRSVLDSREGGKTLISVVESLDVTAAQKLQLAEAVLGVLGGCQAKKLGKETGSEATAAPDGPIIMDQMTCIAPRGKFDLLMHEKSVWLKSSKANVEIPVQNLAAVAVLDNLPKDKKDRILLVFHLKRGSAAAHNKQKLGDIVIQVSSKDNLDLLHPTSGVKLQGPAVVILCQLIGGFGLQAAAFVAPNPSIFKSAAGHGGIEAIVKVNQGLLFPLQKHVIFLERPQIFIALEDIKAVDFARASGMSQTFDVHLRMHDGSVQEFSHIPQAEAPGLQQYFSKQGVRLGGQDQGRPSSKAQPEAAAENSGSDDEEDSDFDPDKSEHSSDIPGPSNGNSRDEEADSPTAQELCSEEDEDESEEDVELFSDDDVPASKVRELVSQEIIRSRSKGSDGNSTAQLQSQIFL